MPRSGKRGKFSAERRMGGFPRHGRREEEIDDEQQSHVSMTAKKETDNSNKGKVNDSFNRDSDTVYFEENGFENDLDR